MSIKNKNESQATSSERPRGLTVGVAAAAGAAAVGAVIGVHNFVGNTVEPDKAAPTLDKTTEIVQLENFTDIPVDMKHQLIYVQGSHDNDTSLTSPTDIPEINLNQVGQVPLTIVEGAGGLDEQVDAALKTAEQLQPDQELQPSVQKSAIFTIKALELRHALEGKSNVVNGGDQFEILKLKDSEGNDLAIVTEATGSVES